MKTYMPLNGLWWSRDSGSANCGMPQSAVLGRPGGGIAQQINHRTYFDFAQYRSLRLRSVRVLTSIYSDAFARHLQGLSCPVR